MIELTLFGTTDLRRDDGAEVQSLVAQPQRFAVLIYLGAAGPRPGVFHRRDTLVGLFWPESGQGHARGNLRGVIHAIREVLGADAIETRGDEELRLAPDLVRCDVAEFDECVAQGKFARADELYRGELAPGFYVPRAVVPDFDHWLSTRRLHLAEEAADVAWKLATRSEGEQNLTDATRWARRAARLALHDERKCRRAFELLIRAGNGATAVMLYDEMCGRLKELDMRPSPETRRLIEDIRRR